jgi:hypothetical protein
MWFSTPESKVIIIMLVVFLAIVVSAYIVREMQIQSYRDSARHEGFLEGWNASAKYFKGKYNDKQ